ncbi:uncharacterized protein LOC125498811 [Beta vulgaris subsp. vulgaris]|uniref:uncharacterized protein LOC125498811 n=1 Tax=Beta vulgaris subsp. vulgaris TaxID=3555 RepID=UPI0020370541|nr:uncharacterized protein LOC125498811 [Beta vulgaris subsp. vulgaris]
MVMVLGFNMEDYGRVITTQSNIFRRSCMYICVFFRIIEGVTTEEEFFTQSSDATGRMGASALQKCTTTIRMLAYGSSSDLFDLYLEIASSTARECLLHFFEMVVTKFGLQYLMKANPNDIEHLLHEGERRCIPSMMESMSAYTGAREIVLWAEKECNKDEAKLQQ